ncbi:hypothetical protein VaNZ11_011759, partial [Volvox africanus]
MTDAFEDLFSPNTEQSSAALDVSGDESLAHCQQTHIQTKREQWDDRLQAAEHRRQEFRAWLLHRARRGSGSTQKAAERAAAEERRGRPLELLQERLAAAEANRAACLARLQRRAAATSRRREGAAERAAAAAAERTTTAAERLEAELAAAESRRSALREAELERLRTEHELVLSRLASSQKRAAAGAEQQRSRLEERLRSAAHEREARLARRAARAASKVERARALGAQTREIQQQETESRRQALEQKLETARKRREGRRPGLSGAGAEGTAAATAGNAASDATSPSAFSSQSLHFGEQSPSPPQSPTQTQSQSQSQSRSQSTSPARSPPPGERAAAATDIATSAGASEAGPRVPVAPVALAVAVAQLTEDSESEDGSISAAASPSQPSGSRDLVVTVAETSGESAEGEGDGDGEGQGEGADVDVDAEVTSRLEGLRRSISSRRLQQVWRAFVQSKRTTRTLAEAFVAQRITNVQLPPSSESATRAAGAVDVPRRQGQGQAGAVPVIIGLGGSSGSAAAAAMARLAAQSGRGSAVGVAADDDGGGDGFDRFASALRSPATLKATQALMRRLEQRLAARHSAHSVQSNPASQGHGGGASPGPSQGQSSAATSVIRLLRRLYPTAPRDVTLERYPPRVLLCGFMVVRHPEVVFSSSGPRETALAAAARDLVERLEALLERIIVVPAEPPSTAAEPAGPLPPSPSYNIAASPVARGMEELLRRRRAAAAQGGSFELPPSPSASSQYMTIGSLLVQFDDAWLRYLDQFVAWKGADAASLEAELVRCAAALEASMLRKCRGDPTSERVRRSSDLQAVIAQVAHDQSLLRERVSKLGGQAGLARLEAALEAARRTVAAEIAERGAVSGSTSTTASEADTTDPESSTRNRRRGYAATRSESASAATSPVLSRQVTPPAPLALPLDVPPVAAPSPAGDGAAAGGMLAGAMAAPLSASAPIAAPPRRHGSAPHADTGGDQTRADGAGGSGSREATGVPPSPLSASPRSPGSLRTSLLGPDGGASDGGGGAVHAAPLDAALVSNAALVHEMLLGANAGSYRLPISEAEAAWSRAVAAMSLDASGLAVLSPGPALEELRNMSQEQLIRALRSRTAAIAECAFWDKVTATIAVALLTPPSAASTRGSPAARLAAVLAPLLSEVALDVASVVISSQQASALRAEFSEAAIGLQIEGRGAETATDAGAGGSAVAAVQRALVVLQRLAGLLVAAGAPAREEEALAAQMSMRQRLTVAVQDYAQQLSPQLPKPSQHSRASTAYVDVSSDGSSASDGNEDAASPPPPPPPPLAAALGRALRLLAAQVKVLKVDAANGRLQALAARLQGNGGVEYLRSKFAAIFRLEGAVGDTVAVGNAELPLASSASASASAAPTLQPPRRLHGQELLQALPRTAAWLRRSLTGAAGIASYIHAQGIDMAAAVAAAAAANGGSGAPVSLRAGLRPPPGVGGPAAARPILVPAVVPVGPAGGSAVDGAANTAAGAAWRWVLRCGLVGLVSSDSPAVGPPLAETLLWDGERLHGAQNQFQQLVVVTAGLLLVT